MRNTPFLAAALMGVSLMPHVSVRRVEEGDDALTPAGDAMLQSNEWAKPHAHTGAREIARRQRQAARKAAKANP